MLCHSEKTLKLLFKIPVRIDKTLLNEDTVDLDYEWECCGVMIDRDLPPGESTRADVWWDSIKNCYTVQGKVVLAMLLIFHGP